MSIEFPLYSISSCRLDGPLSDCEFTSFFALLKRAFDSLNDRKGDVNKITEVVHAFLVSSNTCNVYIACIMYPFQSSDSVQAYKIDID